ncbi:MAG TPA: hypothetical protein VJV79_39615 [Polyangiaceae bacterium]|nr:hypothetical protein [Polyangiaceae bacterium]
MSEPIPALPSERCGCSGPSKRLCDECEAVGGGFRACSLACLARHREGSHGDPRDSLSRAHARISRDNCRFSSNHEAYASHRARLMTLVLELPQGAELCIFGAGDANELELERLAGSFREIHLVDLDGEALARARDRQASAVRQKIVLHERVDASGVLEHLDAWGDRFPERAELARVAVEAAQSIVHGLGLTFPALVSSCLLSQLALPFQQAWLTSRANWADLLSTISAIHLATLAGATRSGGRCLLAFDAASSRETPALTEQRGRALDELAEFVVETRAAGGLHLRPDPSVLLAQLSSPGMKSLVDEPRLEQPWLWQFGEDTELVYGLTFRHR